MRFNNSQACLLYTGYFCGGFIFLNFASQTSWNFPLQFMSIMKTSKNCKIKPLWISAPRPKSQKYICMWKLWHIQYCIVKCMAGSIEVSNDDLQTLLKDFKQNVFPSKTTLAEFTSEKHYENTNLSKTVKTWYIYIQETNIMFKSFNGTCFAWAISWKVTFKFIRCGL